MGLTKDLGALPRVLTVSGSNVGVGKEIPNSRLDINGNTLITGSLVVTQGITGSLLGTASTASFANVAGLGGFVQGGNSFGTQALIGTNDNQSLALETSGSVRMFVSSTGAVGVGATSFAGDELMMVSINGTSNTQGINIKDRNASANASTFMVFRKSDDTFLGNIRRATTDDALYIGGNSYLSLGTGGNTERMRIFSNGNVGINNTSPNERLSVGGNISISGGLGSKIGFNTTDAFSQYSTSVAHYGISYGANTNPLALSGYYGIGLFSDGSERMRIAFNGNVGIGTTVPGHRLSVAGTVSATSLQLTGNYNTSIATNSGWTSFQTAIPTGVLDAYGVYIISARWTNSGGGGPWEVMCSFLFTPVGTNGGGSENEITPLMSTHTGSTGATMTFRSRSASQSTSGLEVRFTNFSNINGTIFISAIKIQQT